MLPAPKYLTAHPAYRALLDALEAQLIKPDVLARRWGWTEQHLTNLRKAGKGPAYIRLGRSIRYTVAEALAWEVAGQSYHVTRDRVALACTALQGLTADDKASVSAQLDSILFARKA